MESLETSEACAAPYTPSRPIHGGFPGLNPAPEGVVLGPMEPKLYGRSAQSMPAGVGDVTSAAPGTAARFNAGKAPFDLVPLRCVALYYENLFAKLGRTAPATEEQRAALDALYALAGWQETGKPFRLNEALVALGDGWAECAAVFDYGRRKYAEWNWAKGFDWSVPLACAARHLKAILDGENTDPESTKSHRGHVYCNVCMLITFIRTWSAGDNRPRLLEPRT